MKISPLENPLKSLYEEDEHLKQSSYLKKIV
jgi:hypothetical protein